MPIDVNGLLILAALGFGVAIGFRLALDAPKPIGWPHDYLNARAEITRLDQYLLPRQRLGSVSYETREILVDEDQPEWQRRFVYFHEVAHLALDDIGLVSGYAENEALADTVAYAIWAAEGRALTPCHSFTESDEPGQVLLSLDQIFECLALAQHLKTKIVDSDNFLPAGAGANQVRKS